MICDAGGGTVDLIVFEIDEQPSKKYVIETCIEGLVSLNLLFLLDVH